MLDETWLWDGSDWGMANPPQRPSPRRAPAMATAEDRGRVVLFGGAATLSSSTGLLNDTWEWDGSNWTELLPTTTPRRCRPRWPTTRFGVVRS